MHGRGAGARRRDGGRRHHHRARRARRRRSVRRRLSRARPERAARRARCHARPPACCAPTTACTCAASCRRANTRELFEPFARPPAAAADLADGPHAGPAPVVAHRAGARSTTPARRAGATRSSSARCGSRRSARRSTRRRTARWFVDFARAPRHCAGQPRRHHGRACERGASPTARRSASSRPRIEAARHAQARGA